MGMREQIVKALLGKAQAPLAGKPGGVWEGGIRAYHSSPHDFDKVDFSKLRTGEGANMYGAGHYMAEDPKVSGQGGQYWQQFLPRMPGQDQELAELLKRYGFDRERAVAELQKHQDLLMKRPTVGTQGAVDSVIRQRQEEIDRLVRDPLIGPRTYEMNLRARPEELLDWDKAYSQQYPDVQKRLMSVSPAFGLGGNKPIGVFAAEPLRNPATAEKLANAGIPAIRYLDEKSRNLATQIRQAEDLANYNPAEWAQAALREAKAKLPLTSNYVGTDPSKLDILAKYGIAGAAAIPPTLGAFTAQDSYEARP